MNRNTQYYLFLFLAGWLLLTGATGTGCRSARAAADGTFKPATSTRPPEFLVKKLGDKSPENLQSLHAHAKINASGEGQSIAATANIIWLRDSILWINVKKFGIEAVRALVTRDSVFMINRIEKTYSAQGIEDLQRQYNLPDGFPLLQQMVLGTAWFFPDMMLQSDIKDELHRLSGNNNRYAADYRIEEGSFLLRRESFVQQKDSRMLTLNFEKAQKLPEAGFFPYLRRIEAYSPETGAMQIEIEMTEVQVNSVQSYRFEIPKHYERIQ